MTDFKPNTEGIDYAKMSITEALRSVIHSERTFRASPFCYSSFHPPHDTPEGEEFYALSSLLATAQSYLWTVTDIEYDRDGFREHVWTWRYWKVEARKCCWYQKSLLTTWRAGWTMKKLHEAEWNLVQVCGLQGIYKSSCEYLEEAFPNLKS